MAEFKPVYGICSETGLRICEIRQHLLVREDGMVRNVNPSSYARNRRENQGQKWTAGTKERKGYFTAWLPVLPGENRNRTTYTKCKVHRLVIEAFGPPAPSPTHQVDHINGIKSDNRIANLRWVTPRQNCQNKKCHQNGRLVGTFYEVSRRKWQAALVVNGRKKHLGRFNTAEEAHAAYLKALAIFAVN